MNETEAPDPRQSRAVFALAALAMAAVAAFLYVKAGQPSKKLQSAACVASNGLAAALDPLAKGEIAALNVAKEPEPLEDLGFNTPEGAPTSLAAFKGKTLLVNIWATWCVPCRAEMPALDRLQEQLGSDRFQVVAVNVDTNHLERPKALFEELKIKALTLYADPKAEVFFKLRQGGGLMGLPTTFLVDSLGCELGRMSGPANWDSPEALALLRHAVGAGE
jgi:thiol-disulfide isomerase/thioredoxin